MKYIYPKKYDIKDIIVIEKKKKFIIKNESLLHVYGIIVYISDCEIKREYKKYKIIFKGSDLELYDTLLDDNIENYKKIIMNDKDGKYIILPYSDKIEEHFKKNKKNLFLNIHYVKKSSFFNIPTLSIL